MAFIPAADTIRIVPHWKNANNSILNQIWYFQTTTPPVTLLQVQNAVGAFETWAGQAASRQWSNDTFLFRIIGTDMSVADSFQEDRTLPVALAGTVVSPALPANVSFVTGLRTGMAGRSFRGRKYWMSLPENQLIGDFLLPAFQTAIVAAVADLQADMLLAGFQMVVASFFANGLPRLAALLTDVLQITTIDSRADTQRRRLIGEGD